MAEFRILLTPEAQADILALNDSMQTRVSEKLAWIGINAQFIRHQSLKGKRWQGLYKYRVGDYRIIYEVNQLAWEITILKVGHRRHIYKR
ncbi:MAG: type II toxin-antitoxin system mRNA interferase toxin, RelE/StbE family [Aquificales bacterium]|nr:type II toxin-antitoxin system mRNA interferase toxin, RelE/StbE family [Aquificales bacterium]